MVKIIRKSEYFKGKLYLNGFSINLNDRYPITPLNNKRINDIQNGGAGRVIFR